MDETVDTFTPIKSAGMAVLLSAINPKNLLLVVGCAAVIAQTGSSTIDQAIACRVRRDRHARGRRAGCNLPRDGRTRHQDPQRAARLPLSGSRGLGSGSDAHLKHSNPLGVSGRCAEAVD
jgi:hypothetical protein